MNRKIIPWLVGLGASVTFSAAYSLYDRPLVLTPLQPFVSLFAIPCFPGLIVGMIATGNAHTGQGSLLFILIVATAANTVLYGLISWILLGLFRKKYLAR